MSRLESELARALSELTGGRPPCAAPVSGRSGVELVFRAVWAYSVSDFGSALELLESAGVVDPESRLTQELYTYVERVAAGRPEVDVYQRPEGFAQFIRGGGNVELYRAVGRRLKESYELERPRSVLDIGSGDGRAVLEGWTPAAGAMSLVEPAPMLLDAADRTLRSAGIPHTTHACSIEAFLVEEVSAGGRRWDLAQATFSLQCLSPTLRRHVLRLLARCSRRLLVVEFDVPRRRCAFDPSWFLRCIHRMERGLAEYGPDRSVVAQGFLVPMMLGFFGPDDQSNHEQPTQAWSDDLRQAGFTVAPPLLLHDYWWAPARLLSAVSEPESDLEEPSE